MLHASTRGSSGPFWPSSTLPRWVTAVGVPCFGAACWLGSWRLEKRSPALQACNRTRNIQADGVPMVHRTLGGSTSRGLLLSPSGTGAMPPKRTGCWARRQAPWLSLGSGAVTASSSRRRSQVAQAPIGNSPPGRFMKI